METIANSKECKPGHLYCAVLAVWSADHGDYRDSFEGLYWADSHGCLYSYARNPADDGVDPAFPDYDYLVEQPGSFDGTYVSPTHV
jgi:hypothetical protein